MNRWPHECDYDFYLASPFFTPEQIERQEFVHWVLCDKGYKVFSPMEQTFIPPDADDDAQSDCFQSNIEGILISKATFAITNDKDIGTIFEAGYSFAVRKPVIYFCEGLPDGAQFNLMLAQSGRRIFTSRQELIDCDNIMAYVPYVGLIE